MHAIVLSNKDFERIYFFFKKKKLEIPASEKNSLDSFFDSRVRYFRSK